MTKKSKFLWEILRKTVHLSSLLIVVGYTILLNYFSGRTTILIMTALLLILLEIEHFRLEHRSPMVSFFDKLFRRKEKDNVSGAVFLVVSCIICFSAFEYWIANLALFMAVFGDMFSALLGKAFGKTKIFRNKTVVGTLAGLSANLGVGFLILPQYFLVFIPMAFMASLVELITNKLDDNLTVPLFAGFIGQMIVYYTDITLPPIDFTFLGLF